MKPVPIEVLEGLAVQIAAVIAAVDYPERDLITKWFFGELSRQIEGFLLDHQDYQQQLREKAK